MHSSVTRYYKGRRVISMHRPALFPRSPLKCKTFAPPDTCFFPPENCHGASSKPDLTLPLNVNRNRTLKIDLLTHDTNSDFNNSPNPKP